MPSDLPHTLELLDLRLVDQTRQSFFQARTARKDPLFRPLPFVKYDSGVALTGADDELAGVAWRQDAGSHHYLDVCVSVEARRQGLGLRLLEAVLPNHGAALALCDAGQRSAIRFMLQNGFEHETSIFAYRWDGDVLDVPPAFKTAEIEPDPAPFTTWQESRLLVLENLPHTIQMLRPAQDDELIGFKAHQGSACVGSIVAIRGRQDFGVLSLWVAPSARGKGIARLLLCAILETASERGVGVVVHLDAGEDHLTHQIRTLGLWTYRTWQFFRVNCDYGVDPGVA
jgi:GNAT superfamily N-acetyltransferase